MTALIAAVVLAATLIQAWAAAKELGRANREAIDTWDTEDQLIAEQPRFQRRRERRELKALRGPELHQQIRRIQLTLGSWVALVCAAAAALARELWP